MPDLSILQPDELRRKSSVSKKLSGVYDLDPNFQFEMEQNISNARLPLQVVCETYWLREPVAWVFPTFIPLQLSGGNRDLQVCSRHFLPATRMGDERISKTIPAEIHLLSYRKGKVEHHNNMSVDGNKANDPLMVPLENTRGTPYYEA